VVENNREGPRFGKWKPFTYGANSMRDVPDMDFIAKAKAEGSHWTDSTQHTEITQTPDSKTGKANPDSPKWPPINPAAKPNTYTGKGGSKRD
jgi:hypothetical protein